MGRSTEFNRAARLLPPELRRAAGELPPETAERAEEIRLRCGREPKLLAADGELPLPVKRTVTEADLQTVMEIATRASVHAYADFIRQGFLPAQGGCRVGLCGVVSAEDGRVATIRRLSSICIRIPGEHPGCADGVFPVITENGLRSTLIISPPGGGKTTLLRELIRLISDGGCRTALCDERAEVAGVFDGRPCFDVGERTDVLTGAPKAEGIYMLLRAMSPQLIALDEITAPEDLRAAEAAAYCGVKLLATAHASDIGELSRRPLYQSMLATGIFESAVVIRNRGGVRDYSVVELC